MMSHDTYSEAETAKNSKTLLYSAPLENILISLGSKQEGLKRRVRHTSLNLNKP